MMTMKCVRWSARPSGVASETFAERSRRPKFISCDCEPRETEVGRRDMIGRLNHIAIAVPDLEAAAAIYRDTLGARVRSEEHTSELKSLMRISYAVFCLKKKNKTRTGSIYRST